MYINIFGTKILHLSFVETTKEVHKVINIFISKRHAMSHLTVTDNLATCLNANGSYRGRHIFASRVWYGTLSYN
jgi:hypothetical protein